MENAGQRAFSILHSQFFILHFPPAPRPGFEPGTPGSKPGMMSVSPSRQKRKARESNPHLPLGRTVLAGRPGEPVSGYLPSVDPPGVEPGSPVCRPGVVPLDHEPVVSGPPGTRTPIPASRRRCRPVGPAARISGDDGNRTHLRLLARQSRRPLEHASPLQRSGRESDPGFHPTMVACGQNTSRPTPSSDLGWSRTTNLLRVKKASFPLLHEIVSPAGRS